MREKKKEKKMKISIEDQSSATPGKGAMDASTVFRQLMAKHWEKRKVLHAVFQDL